jgi:hypothetical protein
LVAQDATHRPRLVNRIEQDGFESASILTKLGLDAQSNFVIPILSNSPVGTDPELLGLMDVQAPTGTDFDTDDVQFAYELSSRYFADFLLKLWPSGQYPVTSLMLDHQVDVRRFSPEVPFIHRQELGFDISDLVTLNFNPMKYLFHWEKIKQLITDQPVDFPSLVEVWPTMTCNHFCDWCRTKPTRKAYKGAPITRTGLIQLADDLAAHAHVDVLISGGGEPLHRTSPNLPGRPGQAIRHGGHIHQWYSSKRLPFLKLSVEKPASFVRVSFQWPEPGTYSQIHFPHRP